MKVKVIFLFTYIGIFLSNLQRLLLNGLLQVNVGLVSDIKRQLQFSDLDLELLLDASYFGLQLSLSFYDASVQLLDLDAGLLTVDKTVKNYFITNIRIVLFLTAI